MNRILRPLLAALALLCLFGAPSAKLAQAQSRIYMAYVGAYSSGTTYNQNDVVISSGVAYVSLQPTNTGNTPATATTFWTALGSASSSGGTITINGVTCTVGSTCSLSAVFDSINAAATAQATAETFATSTVATEHAAMTAAVAGVSGGAVDTRPNTVQSTSKLPSPLVLTAGGSLQIFSATGTGTITEIHVTLGATGSDAPNLVDNSLVNIACDGNLVSVPFGMFFQAMDAPVAYNNDFVGVPVMGSTFDNLSGGGMSFSVRTWINFYSSCTITLVNASSSASSNTFADITYRVGTPVRPNGAPTSRAYWNAYASSLPALAPNSGGNFNTAEAYMMPISTFAGGGEVERIVDFTSTSVSDSYLESGPVTLTDGNIATQSGGGEDWAMCGYYCNFLANSITTARAGFMAGSFLQDKLAAFDVLMYRFFNTRPDDNVIFTGTLGVSIANGDSAFSTSPSIAVSGLTSFWTANPTASVVQYTPGAGTYSNGQTLSLAAFPSGASICYTSNGSTPTATTAGTCTSGTTYSGAITLPTSSTTTINAISTKAGFNNGVMASAAYTLGAPTPPAFKSTVEAASGSTAVLSITSPSITLAAGDFVYIDCYSPGSSLSLTNSNGNTMGSLTFTANAANTGSTRGFYVLSANSGATTFTCTNNASLAFSGVIVMDYSASPAAQLVASSDFTSKTACSTSTAACTSSAITTTLPALVIACGYIPGTTTWTAGTIGGVTATLRASGSGTTFSSTNPVCEDAYLSSAASGITSSLTTSTAFANWVISGAAFHQ
jgi:hypothetical protein